jgi:hypothetical protein
MLHLLLQAQLPPALKLPPRCLLQRLKAAAAHPQPLGSASCSAVLLPLQMQGLGLQQAGSSKWDSTFPPSLLPP